MKPNTTVIALVATLLLTVSLAGCMTTQQADKLIEIGENNNEILSNIDKKVDEIPTTPPASADAIATAVAAKNTAQNGHGVVSMPSSPASASGSCTFVSLNGQKLSVGDMNASNYASFKDKLERADTSNQISWEEGGGGIGSANCWSKVTTAANFSRTYDSAASVQVPAGSCLLLGGTNLSFFGGIEVPNCAGWIDTLERGDTSNQIGWEQGGTAGTTNWWVRVTVGNASAVSTPPASSSPPGGSAVRFYKAGEYEKSNGGREGGTVLSQDRQTISGVGPGFTIFFPCANGNSGGTASNPYNVIPGANRVITTGPQNNVCGVVGPITIQDRTWAVTLTDVYIRPAGDQFAGMVTFTSG